MIGDAIGFLRCPHCHADLALAGRTARCPAGHAFDVARQGYLSLLAARALVRNADTARMVAARQEFLAAGHYRFLADTLADHARQALADGTDPPATGAARDGGTHPPATGAAWGEGCVLDVGGGTGYHLAAVLGAAPGRRGVVLDLSRHAARLAVRAHPRADAVVADGWQPLPVRTGAAALVLNVCAPRNGAELHRVLRPGGTLLVATPTPDHLAELVGPLGLLTVDPRKQERVAGQLEEYFVRHGSTRLERVLELDRAEVALVAGMGPSAHHLDPGRLADAVRLLPQPCPVTAAFHLVTYRLRGGLE